MTEQLDRAVQQAPGGVPKAPIAPQVGQHGQDKDVAQRVCSCSQAYEDRARSTYVGADQEDPRQQPHPEG